MQLIEQIRRKLKENEISVLKLSNETGISAYKIYKWLDGKGSPKTEDSKLLEQWLRNSGEEVLKVKENNSTYAHPQDQKDEIINLLKDKVKLLERENQRLTNNINSFSSVDLVEFAVANNAHLKTILECIAKTRAVVEKVPLEKVLDEQNIILAEATREILKSGKV